MNIVFTGLAGVPYLRRASDNRLMAFAEIYAKLGHTIYIINRYPVDVKDNEVNDIRSNGKIHIHELFNIKKPKCSLLAKLLFIIAFPAELFKIISLNRRYTLNIIQVYSGHYLEYLFYRVVSKLINAKIYLQYVEFRSKIIRKGLYHKINGYLCDYHGYKLFDGAICISRFLEDHLKGISPSKYSLRIPPLCDFDYFDSIPQIENEKEYIIYCGSSGYTEIIKIIIEAYLKSDCEKNNIGLVLVINGSEVQLNELSDYIQGNSNIDLKSNLPYVDLVVLYKSSFMALIPMRNTLQDIARFPQKISEYCASSCIIITNAIGEIPYYFEDTINALLAKDFTAEDLMDKINWVINNRNLCPEIKTNAYLTGKLNFSTMAYRYRLQTFLENLP